MYESLRDRDRIAAAKVIFDGVFKKARLYDAGKRPGGLKRKPGAHAEEEEHDTTLESPNPGANESTAGVSHRVPCGRVPDHTPSSQRELGPDTALRASAQRGGHAEPSREPIRIRRPERGGDSAQEAKKATACDTPAG